MSKLETLRTLMDKKRADQQWHREQSGKAFMDYLKAENALVNLPCASAFSLEELRRHMQVVHTMNPVATYVQRSEIEELHFRILTQVGASK